MRGKLVLSLDSEQHPRRVTLHAVGTEVTSWGTEPAYIARTHPLDCTLELWKPAREGEELAAGTRVLTFAIDLPPTLPPSFDGMLTEIGYGLKAKVDLPRHIDVHAELGLIVMTAAPDAVNNPVSAEAHDDSGRHITLELPRRVYRLGEPIGGTLRIVRPGSGRSRRLKIELLARERGSAQGIWAEHVEREADLRIELEHVAEDSAYPFNFTVPDSAVPTFSGEHSELGWHVSAQLEVARAPDLIVQTGIVVVESD